MLNGNEHTSPSWYRARIKAIHRLLEELPASAKQQEKDRALLRNGVIPEKQEKRFAEILDYEYKLTFSLNEPLSFSELTSFNTWFVMHPEKISGKEVISTSREFPLTIKGSREDIEKAIRGELSENTAPTQKQFEADTRTVEAEPEPAANRFGDPSRVMEWTVSDFHGYYHQEVFAFMQSQEPVETNISELQERLKEAGRDRNLKKEITEKLSEAIALRNYQKNLFESDWLDFCAGIRDLIISRAKAKGLNTEDDRHTFLPDDILLAITDRPGIEVYWNAKIGQVIEQELQWFVNEEEKRKNNEGILELEALALETELQLLNV